MNNRMKKMAQEIQDDSFYDSDTILPESDWRRIESSPYDKREEVRAQIWDSQPIHRKAIKGIKNLIYDDIQELPQESSRYQRLKRSFSKN